MGTNYSRIPRKEEISLKREKLLRDIRVLSLSPEEIEMDFRSIDKGGFEKWNPWEEFTVGTNVHLGKRSGGWKFCWNFHKNKYYSNKEELIKFVLSGRVVNEYGEEIDTWEFLDMAFSWGEPDGLIVDKEYLENKERPNWMSNPEEYYDKIIDGLRVSSSDSFS